MKIVHENNSNDSNNAKRFVQGTMLKNNEHTKDLQKQLDLYI